MVTTRRSSGGSGRRGSPLAVEVPDMAQFVRELHRMAPELEEDLKDLNFQTGERIITLARSNAAGVSRQARKAADTLKSARAKASASIVFNSKRMPFGAGAEFGSLRHSQFMSWRGNGEDAGYFLYPAIREMTPELVRDYTEGLERIARQAGFK